MSINKNLPALKERNCRSLSQTILRGFFLLVLYFVGVIFLLLFMQDFSKTVGIASLMGTGLGTGVTPINLVVETFRSDQSTSESVLLANKIALEQGLLFLVVTWIVALIALVQVLLKLQSLKWHLGGGYLEVLLLGSIGSLYGMFFIFHVGLPMFTLDSTLNTGAFALSIASITTVFRLSDTKPKLVVANRFRLLQVLVLNKRSAVGILVLFVLSLFTCDYYVHIWILRATSESYSQRISVTFEPISSISQPMQDATLAMEDKNFYFHHGIDWEAIHRSLRVDLRSGEIRQGGSTITQQLAKNMFLGSDRTFTRKLEEAVLALEMERMFPKDRLLELYFNTIDYGMGQHGIKAAANFYFHKSASQLTLPECAVLVGNVPDPMHKKLDLNRLSKGQQVALSRMGLIFPYRYPEKECAIAAAIPLDRLIYPFKDAWDRGATEQIPAVWHNVGFYALGNPDLPTPINHVSISLKPPLAAFLDEAHHRFGLTGLDHLGVYNDRPMRQSQTTISAHAFGQAIDISGLRFKDGSQIRVKDHANPEIAARLTPIEALLKQHFPIVVDWRDDPLRHQTHFHCEVRGPRPVSPAVQLLGAAGTSASVAQPAAPEPDAGASPSG